MMMAILIVIVDMINPFFFTITTDELLLQGIVTLVVSVVLFTQMGMVEVCWILGGHQ